MNIYINNCFHCRGATQPARRNNTQCTIIIIPTNVENPIDFEAEQHDRFNAMNVWQT